MTSQAFEALLCHAAVVLVLLIWSSGSWLVIRSLPRGGVVGSLLRLALIMFAVAGSFASLSAFVGYSSAGSLF
jgi:hypothetical protein